MARAEGTFRLQGPPRLDDASSWSNYKKRLAILKACKMSEMHMGALVAMSMTSVDNTQVRYIRIQVLFVSCVVSEFVLGFSSTTKSNKM